MFKNILGIITNISVIFSMLFAIRKAKDDHESTLIPKLGLVISTLSLVLHVLTIFGETKEEKREHDQLDKLF